MSDLVMIEVPPQRKPTTRLAGCVANTELVDTQGRRPDDMSERRTARTPQRQDAAIGRANRQQLPAARPPATLWGENSAEALAQGTPLPAKRASRPFTEAERHFLREAKRAYGRAYYQALGAQRRDRCAEMSQFLKVCREVRGVYHERQDLLVRTARRVLKIKDHRKRLAEIKLERGCIDCGYREHHEALQFDHVRGQKKFNLSRARDYSWPVVMEELAKCEVRCANCHAVKTCERRA